MLSSADVGTSKKRQVSKPAPGPSAGVCPICNRAVKNLRRHNRENHNNKKPQKCEHCKVTMQRKDNMKRHLRSCKSNPNNPKNKTPNCNQQHNSDSKENIPVEGSTMPIENRKTSDRSKANEILPNINSDYNPLQLPSLGPSLKNIPPELMVAAINEATYLYGYLADEKLSFTSGYPEHIDSRENSLQESPYQRHQIPFTHQAGKEKITDEMQTSLHPLSAFARDPYQEPINLFPFYTSSFSQSHNTPVLPTPPSTGRYEFGHSPGFRTYSDLRYPIPPITSTLDSYHGLMPSPMTVPDIDDYRHSNPPTEYNSSNDFERQSKKRLTINSLIDGNQNNQRK